MKRQKITQHTRTFRCVNCNPEAKGEPMDKAAFIEHMKTAHGVELTTGVKAHKKGLQFLDGADFYSNVYEWTLTSPKGDVKLIECASGPKGKGP